MTKKDLNSVFTYLKYDKKGIFNRLNERKEI